MVHFQMLLFMILVHVSVCNNIGAVTLCICVIMYKLSLNQTDFVFLWWCMVCKLYKWQGDEI